MSAFGAAFSTEFLKARRSRVPWAIAGSFSLLPLVGGLFMVILKDPEGARRLGLLGAKAQLTAGTADWPTYLGMLTQGVAIGGAVLSAFLTAWLFGREFSDRTVRGLLAIPTGRRWIVGAKAMVLVVWGVAMSAWVVVLGLAVGALVGLPGWTNDLALDAFGRIAAAAILTIGLQSFTAFFAGVGRGYIPALGWAFFTVFLAQVLATLGWGAWFPWAVPALVAGLTGPDGEVATSGSFVVVAAVVVVGLGATVAWWERADQTG
jgi:ABC-2 type transport system permease protein